MLDGSRYFRPCGLNHRFFLLLEFFFYVRT